MLKVPISKIYNKMKIYMQLLSPYLHFVKWKIFQFSPIFVKNAFCLVDICQFHKYCITYSFLSISVICTRDNKDVTDSVDTKVYLL